MSPIFHAVVAVHVASLLAGKRHRGVGPDLLARTGRTLAAMRVGRVDARAESKPRRWRKLGPHEYTLRMGPVTVSVIGADRTWRWHAAVMIGNVSTTIFRDWNPHPRAQCQADAIAAVERWRDGIR